MVPLPHSKSPDATAASGFAAPIYGKRGSRSRKRGQEDAERASGNFLGVLARLVFLSREDRWAVLDLLRRFSSAVRFAYNRLLEGWGRQELKRKEGPLCTLFGLNTRYADDAVTLAQGILSSARERGIAPRKVVFGSRKLFLSLQRRHDPRRREQRRREWRERRQGHLYARGDGSKGGNLNLRLEIRDGALWLRVNLGDGRYVWASVQTSHPNLGKLLERVRGGLPYNVELTLRDGEVYAHFSWEEQAPPIVHTRERGVLALDINSDPYHLALALVDPDGSLRRHSSISLEEVDRATGRGAKEVALWMVAHKVVDMAAVLGVAIATERLKHLRRSRRGDGSGRAFRRKEHRFAYASLLRKVHALARKRGIQAIEVSPADTSTIGMLKYAPALHLSKDVAAAYVIGRRALGLREEVPEGYKQLLQDEAFWGQARSFYEGLLQELREQRRHEKNPYLKRGLSRRIRKAKKALGLLSSLQGEPGSQAGSTGGRNPPGANPWRVLRVGLFLPLLGREVPRDLSPLKPVLIGGPWEGWKVCPGPHPGGGPRCANVHFS